MSNQDLNLKPLKSSSIDQIVYAGVWTISLTLSAVDSALSNDICANIYNPVYSTHSFVYHKINEKIKI